MADTLFLFLTHDALYHKGIAYISAVLKKHDHSTELLTLNLEKNEFDLHVEISNTISNALPRLIAVSAMTCHWEQLRNILTYTKTICDTPILVGGWHPTLSPEEVINHPAVDYICLGEGEMPTLELLDHFKKGKGTSGIKNIWAKHDTAIHRNPLRPLIKNLDELPLPDRELFSFQNLVDESVLSGIGPEGPKRVAVISTGRGCIYNCSYCCNTAYRKVYNVKPKVFARKRSVEGIITEIKVVIDLYSPDWLEFWEEDFIIDHEWLKEFSIKYTQNFNLPFSILVRPNHVLKDEFKLLREANCKLVYMGIECGNEEYRRRFMKRNVSNDQIINAFLLARENNIATLSFNIVGLPMETLSDIEETIRMNELIKPDFMGCYVYTPFPGTGLYELAKKEGVLKKDISPVYYAGGTPNVTGIEDELFTEIWQRINQLQIKLGELRKKRYPNLFRSR